MIWYSFSPFRYLFLHKYKQSKDIKCDYQFLLNQVGSVFSVKSIHFKWHFWYFWWVKFFELMDFIFVRFFCWGFYILRIRLITGRYTEISNKFYFNLKRLNFRFWCDSSWPEIQSSIIHISKIQLCLMKLYLNTFLCIITATFQVLLHMYCS